MKYAVISIGRSGSSELIRILKSKINVIRKKRCSNINHLYPSELEKFFGRDVKVIFITRNIKDVIKSVLCREKDRGINWIKNHYKNMNSDYRDYNKILKKDTLNFEKLYNSYIEQKIFDVLFIKYECLYFNHQGTIDALCNFTGLKSVNIEYKKNNKWRGNYNSKKEDNISLFWDKSLQQKLDSYDFKLYLTNNILQLRRCGFGSNINQVINSCILVDKKVIKPFYVIWNNNGYYNSDIFQKYFAQPFYNFDNIQINEHYNKIGRHVTGYITPRYNVLNDERPSKQILLPPDNRMYIKSIIDKYIRIDENIKNKAKVFLNKYSDKYKIGLHVRGTGRTHGGIPLMKLEREKEYYYLKNIRNHVKEIDNDNYVIIIFTDNNYDLNYFKKNLNNIECYDSIRSQGKRCENHTKKMNNIKVFEDILIETEIMSEMDYLVHGNSNITNYVLCKNPYLKAYDIYNSFYKISSD